MQIKNSLLIFIVASFISINSFAQLIEVDSKGNAARVFTEINASFHVTIIQPDTNNLVFRVFLTNPKSRRIDIDVFQKKDISNNEIASADYDIINSKTISTDYACSYNMNELGDGDYSIAISDGKERVTKNISIRTVVKVNRVISFAANKKETSGTF